VFLSAGLLPCHQDFLEGDQPALQFGRPGWSYVPFGDHLGVSMGYPGTPKIFSFFDGRNRDLYGINMMGLITRTLAPKGVRHSQTKPFTQFSPCMYLFDLNWFIAAVMAGARERQDHTSEGRCRSYSDARKHVGLDQHV